MLGDISCTKRKDGRWEARLHMGWATSGAGKRVRVRKSFYGDTRREAKAKAEKHKTENLLGATPSTAKVTVSELVKKWLDHQRKRGAQRISTRRRYEDIKKRFIDASIGGFYLEDVTPLVVEHCYDSIEKSRDRGMAHEALRAAFRKAVEWKMVAHSPLEAMRNPHARVKRDRILSDEEITLLSNESVKVPMGVSFWLMLGAGLRISEARALRWADIDLRKMVIRIRNTVVEQRGILNPKWNKGDAENKYLEAPTFELGPVKTASSIRDIPLSPILAARLRVQRRTALETGVASPEHFLVCNKKGGMVRMSNWRRTCWNPLLDRTGLADADFTPHDVRRTFCSLLMRKGIGPKVASELMGHSDTKVTLEVYTQVRKEDHAAAIEVLGTELGGMADLVALPVKGGES